MPPIRPQDFGDTQGKNNGPCLPPGPVQPQVALKTHICSNSSKYLSPQSCSREQSTCSPGKPLAPSHQDIHTERWSKPHKNYVQRLKKGLNLEKLGLNLEIQGVIRQSQRGAGAVSQRSRCGVSDRRQVLRGMAHRTV